MTWLLFCAAILGCIAVLAIVAALERRRLNRLTPAERERDLLDQQTW